MTIFLKIVAISGGLGVKYYIYIIFIPMSLDLVMITCLFEEHQNRERYAEHVVPTLAVTRHVLHSLGPAFWGFSDMQFDVLILNEYE